MEFSEKLRELRKQQNMTQEDLAARLFVSRTAVSKWESAKGYPGIDTLKQISRFFNVSIDELLSGEEIIDIAEKENEFNTNRIKNVIYAILDVFSLLFIFLPLYGQEIDGVIYSLPLMACSDVSNGAKLIFILILGCLSAVGAAEIYLSLSNNEKILKYIKNASLFISSVGILVFVMARQPYLTAIAFVLLCIKVALKRTKNR